MGNYCLDCHDSASKKGERDLENFLLPLKGKQDLISAQELVDQITLKEMPPKKADQPSEEERLEVLRALREGIEEARQKFDSTGARTVMRRLTKREYEVSLATLFGRQIDSLGLTAEFPKELTSQHMDNIGSSLITSGFLLDEYFQAANRLVEMRLNKPRLKPKHWHFKGKFRQYEELMGPHYNAFKFNYLCIYEQPNTETRQGGYGHIEGFLQGVPSSGLYDLEVLAQAMHRDTHYDPKLFGDIDFSEPFQMGVVPGDLKKGHIHYPQAIEPLLAKAVVPDNEPTWIKFRVWLERGQTPRFIFPNGPYESRSSVIKINEKYGEELGRKKQRVNVDRTELLLRGKLPHIRISEIKIHGPVLEPGGSKEELAVFGKNGFQEERALDQLQAFAARAYRRPLKDEERAQLEQTYSKRIKEKATARQAALDTVKMILCSPSFLYLSEITLENESHLVPYDLAARLSYALWSAPPDDALLAHAADGTLKDTKVLRGQVERLLSDKRSDFFIAGFLDSWLNLRELGSMPPARDHAAAYYAEDLPTSMKREVSLFFRNLQRTNGPVTDFLDADYSFIDKKLAKLYDMPQSKTLRLADGFRKLKLKNMNRGGLMGMAAVLTVSANGVDTSPITRGVWVAENILGTPPPPPPDVVPEIDTEVNGSKTIRERLEQHRNSKTCAECHRKIDPLGFPLENFDPVGRWRDKYPVTSKKQPALKIDASGELSSGEVFTNFSEFKQVLLKTRQDAFARHLVKQVLTYATGRHMEAQDRFEIDDILQRVKADKYGMHTLITEALTSEIFRSR
jgi:hypothetical protein